MYIFDLRIVVQWYENTKEQPSHNNYTFCCFCSEEKEAICFRTSALHLHTHYVGTEHINREKREKMIYIYIYPLEANFCQWREAFLSFVGQACKQLCMFVSAKLQVMFQLEPHHTHYAHEHIAQLSYWWILPFAQCTARFHCIVGSVEASSDDASETGRSLNAPRSHVRLI